MTMTSRQRMLVAIERRTPDCLPVTTHHVMPSFLDKYMNGCTNREFFDYFGFDGILWTVPHQADEANGEYYDPNQGEPGFIESRRFFSKDWQIESEELEHPMYHTVRYTFVTPGGKLSMVLQSNEHTTWVAEYLIKEKSDVDIIGQYLVHPKCDVEAVNKAAKHWGERGIVRGHIPTFDVFGQPGCWQDACCLVGAEKMIMATFDDPSWVHTLIKILQERKVAFIRSMQGANYDILELGGGDASTTVISPGIFENFVVPYDSVVIAEAHQVGQRISYHTCGGMMPILEQIAGMNPDAMETFTPVGMGADVDLAEAKRRIGDKVCMIGGFDQLHYFQGCTPEETRRAVRRCFAEAGENGGYIIAPSDHFFDADIELLKAFVDEAHKCVYY